MRLLLGRVSLQPPPIDVELRIDSPEVLPGRHRCLTILLPKGGTVATMSSGARQKLVAAVAERYRQGTSAEKRLILDEFVALTRDHRKHAIRILNGTATSPRA